MTRQPNIEWGHQTQPFADRDTGILPNPGGLAAYREMRIAVTSASSSVSLRRNSRSS